MLELFKSFGDLEIEKSSDSKYGIVKGYMTTFGNKDNENDIILEGAVDGWLKEFRESGKNLQIRHQHYRDSIIGQVKSTDIKIDNKGVYFTGYLNLNIQKSREIYELLKDNTMTDFSIRFTAKKGSYNVTNNGDEIIREFKEISIKEVSIVDEGANPKAVVEEVKSFEKISDVERFLKSKGITNKESKIVISKIKSISNLDDSGEDDFDGQKVLDCLDDFLMKIKN